MSKGALGLLAAYWPEDTPRYAHIPLKRITDVTAHAVAVKSADRVALEAGRQRLTYGDLSSELSRFARSLRNRVEPGARVAIGLADPIEFLVAALGAFEAEVVTFLSAGIPAADSLAAFSPDLVISNAQAPENPAPVAGFEAILESEGEEPSGRPNFRAPILALGRYDGRGEVLHRHRSLVATAVSTGPFFMLDEDVSVVLLEPPTHWHTIALMLGALNRGATLWAGWGTQPARIPERVDYIVCGWKRADELFRDQPGGRPPFRIDGGAIVAVEEPFSVTRRRRLSRRLGTPVLTLFGRNGLGPVVGSHPSWFLDEAAGIPLPNVDTRPLDPADGHPLGLGWDVIEQAELGVKSALAPVGGTVVEGWLRTEVAAEVDPTGLYMLLPEQRLRPV